MSIQVTSVVLDATLDYDMPTAAAIAYTTTPSTECEFTLRFYVHVSKDGKNWTTSSLEDVNVFYWYDEIEGSYVYGSYGVDGRRCDFYLSDYGEAGDYFKVSALVVGDSTEKYSDVTTFAEYCSVCGQFIGTDRKCTNLECSECTSCPQCGGETSEGTCYNEHCSASPVFIGICQNCGNYLDECTCVTLSEYEVYIVSTDVSSQLDKFNTSFKVEWGAIMSYPTGETVDGQSRLGAICQVWESKQSYDLGQPSIAEYSESNPVWITEWHATGMGLQEEVELTNYLSYGYVQITGWVIAAQTEDNNTYCTVTVPAELSSYVSDTNTRIFADILNEGNCTWLTGKLVVFHKTNETTGSWIAGIGKINQ